MSLWAFRRDNKTHQLTGQLREVLANLFDVKSSEADAMVYATKRGKYAGAVVSLLCVFDPTSSSHGQKPDYGYDAVVGRKGSVLYTGRIFPPESGIPRQRAVLPEESVAILTCHRRSVAAPLPTGDVQAPIQDPILPVPDFGAP